MSVYVPQILDGAYGSILVQQFPLVDYASLLYRSLLYELHEDYINAGATILKTNTFGCNLLNYSSLEAITLIKESTKIVEGVLFGDDFVMIAGSIGPAVNSKTPIFNALKAYESYKLQAKALLDSGVDFLLFETIYDLAHVPIILSALSDLDGNFEYALSFSPKQNMLFSNNETFAEAISTLDFSDSKFKLLSLNCQGAGFKGLTPAFNLIKDLPIQKAIYPSYNLASGYDFDFFKKDFKEFISAGFQPDIIGTCCGTTPEYTAHISDYYIKASV